MRVGEVMSKRVGDASACERSGWGCEIIVLISPFLIEALHD